jgi:DNA-binding IclR family transcriptional regulator
LKGVELPEKKQLSDYSVQTIQRACAILRCFMETDTELGLTFISQRVGIHKSTVSRLLSALRREGFVEQDLETGKWRLGFGLLSLAGIVLERMDLRKVAFVPLEVLSSQTHETLNITVLDRNECVNIVSIPSPNPIQYVGRLGRRTPLHCTATGKVLLAFMPAKERDPLLSSTLLKPFTSNSIINRQDLDLELARVQNNGYACAQNEFEEGLSAIAAPIYDHMKKVVAAVSISGPTYRLGKEQMEKIIGPLFEAARQISINLGYVVSKAESQR